MPSPKGGYQRLVRISIEFAATHLQMQRSMLLRLTALDLELEEVALSIQTYILKT